MKVANGTMIRSLNGISQKDTGLVGAKAANLGVLASAGFPVPDGFVLTTEAFERFLALNHLNGNTSGDALSVATIPLDAADALFKATVGLGEGPVAVRSSGIAEDLPGASFAGQYETVLNIRGTDAVAAAVKHCWVSVFSPRVVSYMKARGQADGIKMALLIQQMVAADAAGVAFSANPVTGDRSETLVSAVRGLGERLVSGQASPDEWIVRPNEVTLVSSPENAIQAAQVREIADLARRVEQHFGTPQDIEWAIAGGKLFLLQARPITTLPQRGLESVPVPVVPPPGFWERESFHFPQPLSPLMRSSYIPAHIAGMENMCHELSLPFDKFDFQEIGGWLYQRLVPLGGKDRKPAPDWLMYLVLRLVPQMRSLTRGMGNLLRTDIARRLTDRWYDEWKPGQMARIAELRAVELTPLSDQDLSEHLIAVMELLTESLKIHAMVTVIDFANALLAFTCRDLMGWDSTQTLRLLSGLSSTTSEASVRLAGLTQMVQDRPALRQLLESGGDNLLDQMVTAAPDFARTFAAYQNDFGYRAMAFELAVPTVAENPALTMGLIRSQLKKSYNPQADAARLTQEREDAMAAARKLLAGRPATDRERFERDLKRAQRGYPVREDHEFYLGQAPLALFRFTALEIGRRLAQRGQIREQDDIFCLELPEVRTALSGGGDQKSLVLRRKGERVWVEAHPGPASYGKSAGPPPSVAPFPRDARTVMEGVLWVMDSIFAADQSVKAQQSRDSIKGIAASPGRYTGSVRVIMNESEFSRLSSADVMVCPTTSPAWSMVFPSLGALVTDSGGILSHPAIIAREFRVPAVVATGNATQLLKDGQRVTVDGSGGTVKVETR